MDLSAIKQNFISQIKMEFAIVDIETTGGYANGNGITEISIQVHDGQRIVQQYETLINPEQSIPYYIRGLTGITDEMVANAPTFEEVAEKIFSVLQGRVFVAHNVNFDFSFVKAALAVAGFELTSPKLCTIRLSRKIFPGLPSYSLGNLCGSLDIHINNRHRAGGDALATAKLFELLLANDKEQLIKKFIKKNSKERILPPNVPVAQFDKLPETPGVYYFHDQKGKPVYVGKAVNIKKRVTSHFSNNGTGKQKQEFLRSIFSITYEECGNELMALILESHQIKQLWPAFNRAQKHFSPAFGIYNYQDQRGFNRLCIEKVRKGIRPIISLNGMDEGYSLLRQISSEFKLCLRLTGVATNSENCEQKNCDCLYDKKTNIDAYNKRLQDALNKLNTQQSFVITETGRRPEELALVVVENGTFSKMGYVPATGFSTQKVPDILPQLTSYKENFTIRQLISSYTSLHPERVAYY